MDSFSTNAVSKMEKLTIRSCRNRSNNLFKIKKYSKKYLIFIKDFFSDQGGALSNYPLSSH